MKNRMFGDEEPQATDNRSPRTTIVGGRPPEKEGPLPPVPTGLQRLLRMASVEDGFRAELLARRSGLAQASGVELSGSERAVLDAATAGQLSQMVASLPAPPTDRRTFLREAAVAALAVLAAPVLQGCTPNQALAEAPPRPDRPMATRGIRPRDTPLFDEPDAGRPDRPEMHTKGGHPPEPPPPRPDHNEMQTEGGIAPDEPDLTPIPQEPDAGPRPERPQPTRGIRVDLPPGPKK